MGDGGIDIDGRTSAGGDIATTVDGDIATVDPDIATTVDGDIATLVDGDIAMPVADDISTTTDLEIAAKSGACPRSDIESQAIDEPGDDVNRTTDGDRRPYPMRLARMTARA